MLKSGDTSPLWLTEFGWTTSTTSGGVSPSTQATYVDQAYTQIPNWSSAVGSNVNVQGAFYYDLQDDGSDTSNDQDNYGLVYYNGTDKPAASVFITDAARLY
jgi:exo-beta-1,3-glucanase (GH17 family)